MIKDYYENLNLSITSVFKNEYGVDETSEIIVVIQGIINQATSSEVEYAKARNIDVDYHCYLEATTITKAIKKNDKINGYRVVSKPKNTMDKDHHLKILLAEVI